MQLAAFELQTTSPARLGSNPKSDGIHLRQAETWTVEIRPNAVQMTTTTHSGASVKSHSQHDKKKMLS